MIGRNSVLYECYVCNKGQMAWDGSEDLSRRKPYRHVCTRCDREEYRATVNPWLYKGIYNPDAKNESDMTEPDATLNEIRDLLREIRDELKMNRSVRVTGRIDARTPERRRWDEEVRGYRG